MSKSTDDLIRELEGSGVLGGGTAVSGKTPSTPSSPASGRQAAGSSTALVIVAVVLVALLGSLPFGSLVLYPFALFVTLIHESSHALAAVLTGGSVSSLAVSPDLSGVTSIAGGADALIFSAGYLGATLAGAALLLTPVRHSRWALGVLAAVPVTVLVEFHPASLFTAVWCLAFAIALGAAAWLLPPRFRAFLQIFLGVEAGLNAFRDLMTLLFISESNAHIYSDAVGMSHALWLPPAFWAATWTLVSIAVLAASLLALVRRDLPGLNLRVRRRRSSIV